MCSHLRAVRSHLSNSLDLEENLENWRSGEREVGENGENLWTCADGMDPGTQKCEVGENYGSCRKPLNPKVTPGSRSRDTEAGGKTLTFSLLSQCCPMISSSSQEQHGDICVIPHTCTDTNTHSLWI
ncbi:Replication protein E1 [Clarias magur]|uniref:Replication protein E1 n=1 Tax=Clarias magur TaxID=1594786 RepID=A0A8J4TP05_CLAMG|nr:Replication protein E1 [Clarias magur]